jgi:hypothetical protein
MWSSMRGSTAPLICQVIADRFLDARLCLCWQRFYTRAQTRREWYGKTRNDSAYSSMVFLKLANTENERGANAMLKS